MDYWYIWFEVFEDGKAIKNSRGRYHKAYKHKSSAERRAKQMWSQDLENPLTGTTISRKWIVSQTNPWEDIYILKTRTDVEDLVRICCQAIQRHGIVTRADLKECLNKPATWVDDQYGWVDEKSIKDARVTPMKNGYLMEFPRAVPIC